MLLELDPAAENSAEAPPASGLRLFGGRRDSQQDSGVLIRDDEGIREHFKETPM